DVAVGVNGFLAVATGVTTIGLQTQPVARLVVGFAERSGTRKVLRRFAVAEGHRAILRAEEAGILVNESAIARLDPHVSRQTTLSRTHQLRHGGAEIRVDDTAIF